MHAFTQVDSLRRELGHLADKAGVGRLSEEDVDRFAELLELELALSSTPGV
jgi:hypothetical protein